MRIVEALAAPRQGENSYAGETSSATSMVSWKSGRRTLVVDLTSSGLGAIYPKAELRCPASGEPAGLIRQMLAETSR